MSTALQPPWRLSIRVFQQLLSNTQIWAVPCVLGATSAVGLIAALLADRVGDAVSWIALAAPVVVSLRGLWRPRSRQQTLLDSRAG